MDQKWTKLAYFFKKCEITGQDAKKKCYCLNASAGKPVK